MRPPGIHRYRVINNIRSAREYVKLSSVLLEFTNYYRYLKTDLHFH